VADPAQDLKELSSSAKNIEKILESLLDPSMKAAMLGSSDQEKLAAGFPTGGPSGSPSQQNQSKQQPQQQPDTSFLYKMFPWLQQGQQQGKGQQVPNQQPMPSPPSGGGSGGPSGPSLNNPPEEVMYLSPSQQRGRELGQGLAKGFNSFASGYTGTKVGPKGGLGGAGALQGTAGNVVSGIGKGASQAASAFRNPNALQGVGGMMGAASTATAAIPYVGPVISGVLKFGEVVVESVDKLRKWGDELHRS